MKITPADFAHIQTTIVDKLESIGHTIPTAIAYCKQSNPDWSDKAVRWYLLHGAGLTPFVCGTLYKYLNDDNIDTALRHITSTK